MTKKIVINIQPAKLLGRLNGNNDWEDNEKDKYYKIGKKFKNLPPNEWRGVEVDWNLNPSEFFRSFDGCNSKSIKERYPDGFSLGEIETSLLHSKIFIGRKINDYHQFWKECDKDKACGVLGRFKAGEKVTPPFFCINKQNDEELILENGCHRFNISYLLGKEKICFIVPANQKAHIACILPTAIWLTDS